MKLSLNYKQVAFIILFIVMLILILFFSKCSNSIQSVEVNNTDSIAIKSKVKDSILVEVVKHDTIRVEIVKRYRVVKKDTIYKECEPIIKICDSIIIVDSSEISLLKHVVNIDSSIIGEYKERITKDSLSIDSYKKAIKKHLKRKKWFIDGRCHHFTKETIM